jgi:hypothetical protein
MTIVLAVSQRRGDTQDPPDGFYNPRRRFSALGFKSPAAFEANMASTE